MPRSLSEGTFHFNDSQGRVADPDRLRRLRETGLIGVRDDPGLDRLTRLTAQITGAGITAVALVEATRQVFPSAHGLAGVLEARRETPLSTSFSRYVVINDAPLVVADARVHPVLRHSPAIAQHGVVSYAGAPLHDPSGQVLGALCLIESTPRVWSAEHLEMLESLAATIDTEIALRLASRQTQLGIDRMRVVIDDSVHTAILTAGADGVVDVMNHSAERFLGLGAASVIGIRSLASLLRASQPLGRDPGEGRFQDRLMVDGAGRKRVLSVCSNVLRDSSGLLDGYTLVAYDVSAGREAEALLREAARKQHEAALWLTELDRVRHDFITTTSHELRTPLAVILSSTELLADGAAGRLTAPQLRLVDGVDRNGRRLFSLAEDLLDLCRPASETVRSAWALMDGNAAAEHAWESLQPHLAGRGIQAHLELSDASPQIVGDAAQVERALVNLLTNAAKFTLDDGALRLIVRACPDGVEYEVSDTGIGIPDAEQVFIFDPFFRARQAHSLAIPGTGIGLSVVRRIVESHQGQVHVTSGAGKGTTVVLAFPATEQGPPSEHRPDPTAPGEDLEAELRLALEGDVTRLVLHYRPVVDLTSGKVVGVEAVLHWQHPARGLLAPEQFMATAAPTDLVDRLGDWVLEQAARDAVTLTHQGRELDIAVDCAARRLDDRAVARVRSVLEDSGLRPGRLVLEVTESGLLEDEGATGADYEGLARLGVRIAIANFGTGASSLLHLRRHPVGALKIDSRFVAGIGESADDEAICESIVGLAAAVGATTVGEGIETTAQYAVLRSLGCLRGQGPLWSPAVPIDELASAFAACDAVPDAAPRSRLARTADEVPPEAATLIARMHAEGASTHTIAAALNRTVGRHPKGVRWTAGAVAQAMATPACSPVAPAGSPAAAGSWPHG